MPAATRDATVIMVILSQLFGQATDFAGDAFGTLLQARALLLRQLARRHDGARDAGAPGDAAIGLELRRGQQIGT
ncbi:MAG TPA: hypothetical protein VKI18_17450 [Albitalea sp.]|nr:hypothetical protein [Albitalea sp.]